MNGVLVELTIVPRRYAAVPGRYAAAALLSGHPGALLIKQRDERHLADAPLTKRTRAGEGSEIAQRSTRIALALPLGAYLQRATAAGGSHEAAAIPDG